MVGGVLIVGQILEGYVIYPRFLGDRVELPRSGSFSRCSPAAPRSASSA